MACKCKTDTGSQYRCQLQHKSCIKHGEMQWHTMGRRCVPVAEHEGKGGYHQRHSQGPYGGSCVEVAEGYHHGNVQSLHGETLPYHPPSPSLDSIQRQLNPDANQISHPVAASPRRSKPRKLDAMCPA